MQIYANLCKCKDMYHLGAEMVSFRMDLKPLLATNKKRFQTANIRVQALDAQCPQGRGGGGWQL